MARGGIFGRNAVRVTLSNPGGGRRRAGLNGRAHAAKGNLSLVLLDGRSRSLAVLAHRPRRRLLQDPRHLHRAARLSGPPLAAANATAAAVATNGWRWPWLSHHVGHAVQVSGVTLIDEGCSRASPAAGVCQAPATRGRQVCLTITHSRGAVLGRCPTYLFYQLPHVRPPGGSGEGRRPSDP